MGWPVVGNFNASVQGPQINPSVVEADGEGASVASPQQSEQVQQNGMQAQQPAQQLAQHAAFVDKLFAEATRLAYADQQKSFFKTIGSEAKGLDKQSRKAVNEACTAVKNSLAALDKLTGRQIAEYARSCNATARNALGDALQAHMDLADLLMNASKEKPKMARALQDQAVLLNKRVCTIAKLIGELDAERTKAQEGGNAEALARTHQTAQLGAIEDRNSDAGRELRQKLGEIARQTDELPVLKKLASGQEISNDEIADAKAHLKDLARQLDGAAGKAADPLAKSLIAAARAVLDRARERLAKTDLSKLAKMAAAEVVKLISLPGAAAHSLLRGLPNAAKKGYQTQIGRICDKYDVCDNLDKELRTLAERIVKGGNDEKKKTSDALAKKSRELSDALDSLEESLKHCRTKETDTQVKGLFDSLRTAFGQPGSVKYRIQEAVGHLKQLAGQQAKLDGCVLKRVLDDPSAFSAVVEARVRGLDPALIDFDLSTGNLKGMEKLGSGAFSSAYRCTFARTDGTEDVRVFKPDGDATRGLGHARVAVFSGRGEEQKAIDNNVMAHEVAEMIGAGHTVCKSSAGFVNGQFGFLMEEAPGINSDQILNDVLNNHELNVGEMKFAHYLKLPMEPTRESPVAKNQILAQMAQQLNQLQWADLIAGQLDRHGNNYNISISEGGQVTIKGFDNDQCGAAQMAGIGKVRVTDTHQFAASLMENLQQNDRNMDADTAFEKAKALMLDLSEDAKGFDLETGGVIDISQLKTAKQLRTLIDGTALRSVAPPTYMDRDVYENIMRLTNDVRKINGRYEGEQLKVFREKLGARGLTDAQVEAAVARLMEARDIGIKLDGEHKVYTLDQLENMETLNTIVNNERQTRLNATANEDKDLTNTVQAFGTNYFNRPEFVALMPQELIVDS